AAGKRIRKTAAAADKETPTRRVQMIAEIFRHFKNPDKETVLTPWRVVNMHMSDTIGGWCFFNEQFEDDTSSEKHRLEEPRFVDRGKVTADVFREDGQTLEINSKTGLYPLYVAYSYYKQKLEGMSDDDWEPEDLQYFWNDTIKNNIFVICKTPMAKSITARTLRGFGDVVVNAHYFDDLVNMLKNKPEQFKKRVLKGSYWKREVKTVKFNAIVGNPPYQVMNEGAGASATAVYNDFVDAARNLEPDYVSMIIPARWFAAGRGVDAFRASMLSDRRIRELHDYQDATVLFPTVEIKGGVTYFLWDKSYDGDCRTITHKSSGDTTETVRPLLEEGMTTYIRDNEMISILEKVKSKGERPFADIVSPRDPFGYDVRIPGTLKVLRQEYSSKKTDVDTISFYTFGWRKDGVGYVSKDTVREHIDWISKPKVMIANSWGVGDTAKDWASPFIPDEDSVCTETYLVIGPFESKDECNNVLSYINTKFFHILVSIHKISQHATQRVYQDVPIQDFSKKWSDKALYEKYGLNEEEIAYIESTIASPLDNSVFKKMINSSYAENVKYLLKKYGKAKHDYFKDTACIQKNALASRASEGLYCHHIDEDKAILLSNDRYAKANPFAYQKASRLVYCNLLEHLLLHVKIAAEPKADGANENEMQGIGGAIKFICKELNDIYAGKEYAEAWRKNVANAVRDNFDDYILILKYLWQVVENNPLYKAVITKETLCVGFDGKVVPLVLNALISDEY
ncbi:MAG: Eco57I restriction-modification methylase domain-containing protein, partial [Bacteroidaceae bacterium]|nr:Eco57I restriction-modification methylase domain-containing protein [Bacteroidaceae bacterium]